MKKMTLAVFLYLIILLPLQANQAIKIGPLVYLNVEGGGDSIATPLGGLTAGGGVHIAAGIQIDIDSLLSAHVTYGYKTNTLDSEEFYIEDDISFTRWPLEAMVFLKVQEMRLGGGFTLQNSIKYNFDVFPYIPETVDFKSALGVVIQVDKVWPVHDVNPASFIRDFGVGFRATFIEYESKDGLDLLNGNSFGLNLSVVF